MEGGLFVGGGGEDYGVPQYLRLDYANRHGLVAGATGTGKTVTLQILAEGFSRAGVPVFMSDVKGDLSGMAEPGSPKTKLHPKLVARAEQIGLTDYGYEAFPVTFWDVFGKQGHPLRSTVSEMGPLLLSRMLELNDTQEGVLNIAFRIADEEGLLLLDLRDLRALLQLVGERSRELSLEYGNVSKASVGAIQRRLLVLENQGAKAFFGEPALQLSDMIRVSGDGRGQVNILDATKLMQSPRLYATFLLWLLSELFEELPEVGDPDKPVFVFFFDEAHLLFNRAPRALMEKVEQVARLIRSKGIGVYFVTQRPDDVPEDVLAQLGNRVQHALRAFTPRDRRALKQAAETFRPNPRFETETAIMEVGTGEAVTSFLERKGAPGISERTLIRPPSSKLGPCMAKTRKAVIAASPVAGLYDKPVDRESAYEVLRRRAAETVAVEDAAGEFSRGRRFDPRMPEKRNTTRRRSSSRQSVGETFAKSLARSIGSGLGRAISRGTLGGLFRGR